MRFSQFLQWLGIQGQAITLGRFWQGFFLGLQMAAWVLTGYRKRSSPLVSLIDICIKKAYLHHDFINPHFQTSSH
ncbi:hypothetical protein I79_021739 [Cricetulus griseus]|uniref:Uncharacterized protein n=1 Tax=Cricetulus griseus TaxID=10029 RepID=G3IDG1_CRIGR|nr:hypothetical protein I79_021739 [Cricetulus griseus]